MTIRNYTLRRYIKYLALPFFYLFIRYVWLVAWQIRLSVCLSSVMCAHPTQGFNFSGIFLHHIVAWPSGNSPTKTHKDRPRRSTHPRWLNRKGVIKQAISSSDEFLVTTWQWPVSQKLMAFAYYIYDFSVLCIHILIQLTKEHV